MSGSDTTETLTTKKPFAAYFLAIPRSSTKGWPASHQVRVHHSVVVLEAYSPCQSHFDPTPGFQGAGQFAAFVDAKSERSSSRASFHSATAHGVCRELHGDSLSDDRGARKAEPYCCCFNLHRARAILGRRGQDTTRCWRPSVDGARPAEVRRGCKARGHPLRRRCRDPAPPPVVGYRPCSAS